MHANRPGRVGAVRRSKLALTLAAALTGGSLLGTCELRLRQGLIDGSKGFLSSLLDPTTIVGSLFEEADGSTESP